MKKNFFLEQFYEDESQLKYDLNSNGNKAVAILMLDGSQLRNLDNQTNYLCMIAIKNNPLALKYVKNQTPQICLAAVNQNGQALQYVHNQTEEICMAAVNRSGACLKYVRNQTPEICLAAIKAHPQSIDSVIDLYGLANIITLTEIDLLTNRAPGHYLDTYINFRNLKEHLISNNKVIAKMESSTKVYRASL
ncbi:MAG: DUF4116 domain-containing protein [Oscillospiraceae bacterium]